MTIAVTRKMKILIAEEDFAQRRAAVSFLATTIPGLSNPIRYEIFEAESKESAINLLQAVHPDLVLIAIQDNGLDGKELCRAIRAREHERHTGVIFIARGSNIADMLPVECLEIGGDDFLPAQVTPREMIARINAVLRLKDMTDELRRANHRLEMLSLTDELTGLHNMRSFNIQYDSFLKICRSGQSGLGVIMIDLDHFKTINDTTNHLVGSHVISDVGKLIRLSGILAGRCCPARYGGDEYVIAALSDSAESVVAMAEQLRVVLATAQFTKDVFSVRVTASIGVAWVPPAFSGKQEDPIKAADAMLYRAKELGRNQVRGMILDHSTDFEHLEKANFVQVVKKLSAA